LSSGGEKGKVRTKCKELAIADLYRKIEKNPEVLFLFKQKFDIIL
jgi:hypothetical protein